MKMKLPRSARRHDGAIHDTPLPQDASGAGPEPWAQHARHPRDQSVHDARSTREDPSLLGPPPIA
jgi:hypothetical protein